MALISDRQWTNVMLEMLGLRSGISQSAQDQSAASYAMDCGLGSDNGRLPPIPGNWDDLLGETLTRMKQFPNADSRFLLLVRPSSGAEGKPEYAGCFNKSSSKPTTILAGTALSASVDDLKKWVVANIPS